MKFRLTARGRQLCRDGYFSFKFANSQRSRNGGSVVRIGIDDVIQCNDPVGCRMIEQAQAPRGIVINGAEPESSSVFERTTSRTTITVD